LAKLVALLVYYVRERKNKERKIGERGRIRGKPTSIELVALLGPIT